MAINDIFDIGRQGIEANRRALTTTSNNVANANTPGYSRQRAVFQSDIRTSQGGVTLGGGVRIDRVMRIHNDFVQGQIMEESRAYGGFKARSESLMRIEGQINEQGKQLSERVNNFFNSWRELSTNPEQSTLKLNAINATEDVGRGFRKINDALESLKKELDINLSHQVNEVNQLTREVANLNQAITQMDGVRDIPHELFDRREDVLRQLSLKLGFQTYYDERGAASVVSGSTVLVQGVDANQLEAVRTPASEGKSDGSVDIMLMDPHSGRSHKVKIEEGELGGAIDVRDKVIHPLIRQLDEAAFRMGQAVNQTNALDDGRAPLFDISENTAGAAAMIQMNPLLKENPDAIGAGFTGAPGDNRLALEIASLGEKTMMPEFFQANSEAAPRLTLGESLNSMMGFLGVETRREKQFFESSERIMNQLENYRQSVSGVSLEEEAINMIQYQHAFNAAAKATKVGDELLQTILSLKD